MTRLIFIVTGALLIGIAIGSLLQRPEFIANNDKKLNPGTPDTYSFYQDSLNAKESAISKLTAENHALTTQIIKLDKEIMSLAAMEINSAPLPPLQTEITALEPDESNRRPNWNAQDEESRARRQEFFDQIRTNMLNIWDKEWEKGSPESQERISTIAKFQQDLLDIRDEMRGAETDEQRALIIEEMNTTRNALNQTLKTEQNAQLTTLAEKYGIKDQAAINRFIQETQDTLKSPVFQTNISRGGFGGGGLRGNRFGGQRPSSPQR